MRIGSGAGAATGGSSAELTIPNASGGSVAEVVVINVSAAAYVLPVKTGGSVTNATGMLVNPDAPVILNVKGCQSIAHLQVAAAGRITCNPIENHS